MCSDCEVARKAVEDDAEPDFDPIQYVWFPMGDQPLTVRISREQLQMTVDALRGDIAAYKQGWLDGLAEQIEGILRRSLQGRERKSQ